MKSQPGGRRDRRSKDILERLRRLSVNEKVQKHSDQAVTSAGSGSSAPVIKSQYQLNYVPLAEGVRVGLWQEGFNYRNERKQSGFNHFKLEWNCPTERGRRGSYETSSTSASSASAMAHLEHLDLPMTKLEKKVRHLHHLYEKQRRPRSHIELKPGKDLTELLPAPPNSYERNKQNNLRSHIVLPSYRSSTNGSEDGDDHDVANAANAANGIRVDEKDSGEKHKDKPEPCNGLEPAPENHRSREPSAKKKQ